MATAPWSPGEFINPGDLRAPRSSLPTEVQQIDNGDFEAGNVGWTFEDPAITITTSANAFDGTHIMVWASSLYGTHYASNTELVEVVAGQVITAQMRYRRDTNNSGRQGTSIGIAWYESDGTTLIDTTFSSEYNTGATGIWYGASNSFTAPATAAFARLVIAGRNNNDGGTHGQYWDAISWNYIKPAAQAGLVYRAVQADAGFTAAVEPTWPITLGATVVDNQVTWEAVLASSVTWEATPILESGAVEPTWPTEIGAQILDNNIAWQAISRMIEDSKCPHSKVVVIGASKVFAADRDIIAYCATTNPLDWSTKDDAGYLPFGLQSYGANPVAAMGLYRSNLVAFNSQGFQMWQIDQDPQNMAYLDGAPVSSTYARAICPIANDLALLNPVGVRNLSVAGASTNLQADGVGEPIDALVKAKLKELGDPADALGGFWPAQGQYWLICNDEAYVLTINAAKKKSWSRYTFPHDITDATLSGNDLVLRTAEDAVWRVDYEALRDDIYAIGEPAVLDAEVSALDEITVIWTAADTTGAADVDYYRLFVSIDGAAFDELATVQAGDPLEFVHADLESGIYSYGVDYVDANGHTAGMSNIDTVELDAVPHDEDFADVVVLLTANTGAMVEWSGLPTVSVVGDGALSTGAVKFGTHAFRNPGTNTESTDYYSLVDTSDGQGLFVFPGEFTIEGWFYIVNYNVDIFENLLANSVNYPNVGFIQLALYSGSTPPRGLFWNSNPGEDVVTTEQIPVAQWVHLAVARDASNNVRFFVDGELITTVMMAGTMGKLNPLKSSLDVGRGISSDNSDANCYFDQIRMTKKCRYTATFVAPTAPFPTGG